MDHVSWPVSQITIEPVVFLYHCSSSLSELTGQNLLLLKVCLEDTAPTPGQSDCRDEATAQKAVTQIQTWRDLITVIGAAIFVVFAGTWSDSHGRRRKPLLYLPLLGRIISDLLCVLNVYFWKWSPSISALAQSIPIAITGGSPCFQVGQITYISDITTEYSRTFRIGVIFAMHFLAKPFSSALLGAFYNTGGLNGMYWLCVILNFLSVVYLWLFISERYVEDKCEKKAERFVDLEQVLQCVKTVFKPREGYRRAVILLSVALAPITAAPGSVSTSVAYFFFRYKFHWNAVEFGYYGAYVTCIIFIGTFITIGVFNRLLNISDTMIGIWSQATQVISSIGFAFANTISELILWPLVDFMHGAGIAIVYSILSKNIAPSELAQVNSVVSIVEATYPLFNLPLTNQLYNHTFEVLPGAVFIMCAVYSAVALVLFFHYVLICFSVTHILQNKTNHMESLIKNSG